MDWSHVDVDTVERLLSFLYWGDYSVPDPEPISDAQESECATEASDTAVVVRLPQTPTPTQNYLGNEIGLPERQTQTEAGRFSSLRCSSLKYSYRGPLMAHAQVYVLAHQHLLKDLEKLALQRMAQTLLGVDIHADHTVVELMDLVEYVYENTDERSEEVGIEPMRKILSHFIAANITGFLNAKGEYGPGKVAAMKVVAGGGAFMLDLTRKLGNRLAVEASYAENLEKRVREMEKKLADSTEELARGRVKIEETRSRMIEENIYGW